MGARIAVQLIAQLLRLRIARVQTKCHSHGLMCLIEMRFNRQFRLIGRLPRLPPDQRPLQLHSGGKCIAIGGPRSTLVFGGDCRSLHRQAHSEARVSRYRLDLDDAAKFLINDAMDNLQAQPGARSLWLGRKKCFEDVRECFRRDSGAMIGDADGECWGFGSNRRLGPCRDLDSSFVG